MPKAKLPQVLFVLLIRSYGIVLLIVIFIVILIVIALIVILFKAFTLSSSANSINVIQHW